MDGWPALNYIDDMVIEGRGIKNHNKHLRQILERLNEVGLKVNQTKAEIGLKKTIYLEYTIQKACYSLEDYILVQSQNIPPIKSRRDLFKIIGILNVCRGVCPGFNMLVQEVYDLPKDTSSEDMRRALQSVWEKVLLYNLQLIRDS